MPAARRHRPDGFDDAAADAVEVLVEVDRAVAEADLQLDAIADPWGFGRPVEGDDAVLDRERERGDAGDAARHRRREARIDLLAPGVEDDPGRRRPADDLG